MIGRAAGGWVDINAQGDASFTYDPRAWVGRGGQRIEPPDPPGGSPSVAWAINDRGEVVGSSRINGHFQIPT